MEDIMLIQSSFMRNLVSRLLNQYMKKTYGITLELDKLQMSWNEKAQKANVHLEIEAEMPKAALNDILKKAGIV